MTEIKLEDLSPISCLDQNTKTKIEEKINLDISMFIRVKFGKQIRFKKVSIIDFNKTKQTVYFSSCHFVVGCVSYVIENPSLLIYGNNLFKESLRIDMGKNEYMSFIKIKRDVYESLSY
jgi:hypothetical protein